MTFWGMDEFWSMYMVIGVFVAIAAVYFLGKLDDFQDPFDFSEFMLNNMIKLMCFWFSILAWPLAVTVGGCYVYWQWREGELSFKKEDDH